MSKNRRLLLGLIILLLVAGTFLVADWVRRKTTNPPSTGQVTLEAGDIPIYRNGELAAAFSPADLEKLDRVNFVEPVEQKTQEGWLLRDVLLHHFGPEQLSDPSVVVVSSSSRNKQASLTWAEIADPQAMVMFDLSNRGTLKLVSKLEKLDSREEWVQDVDRIEITP